MRKHLHYKPSLRDQELALDKEIILQVIEEESGTNKTIITEEK
jgi:hypothetical protein